jgi:hypothetical protein
MAIVAGGNEGMFMIRMHSIDRWWRKWKRLQAFQGWWNITVDSGKMSKDE